MDFSFAEALRSLGRDAGFRIINTQRPSNEYLFNTLLPEVNKTSYYVEDAFMVIRTTMAGLVGMSSPYPPGGVVEASTFLEKSAKIAQQISLEEEAIRQLQEILRQRGLQGAATNNFLVDEALGFYDKVVVQAQMDTAEWLRGRALIDGAIDWTFNNKNLNVDYQVPTDYFGATRTGNDAYTADHADNKFWVDHRAALAKLKYNVRAIIARTDSILALIANQDRLKLDVSQNGNVFTLRRYRTRGNAEVLSGDVQDSLSIIAYDGEGEVIDPADTSKTIIVPFMDNNKLLYVANNRANGYRVGEGSTRDPVRDMALGITHVAPTVEGGGRPGRWGDMYTPQDEPWALVGRGATNLLPVRTDVTETMAKTYVSSWTP